MDDLYNKALRLSEILALIIMSMPIDILPDKYEMCVFQ